MDGLGGAQMQSGPASPPPPIDDERRARSPGLAKNFYDLPQSDFKRPYGFGGGGGGGQAAPPPPPAAPQTPGADVAFGAESPMPGREQEYQQWMASGGAQMQSGPASPPPPIDDERRARSPGLAKNFYDLPQSDFKRPYGFGGGGGGGQAAPPPPPAAPQTPGADVAFGAESPMPGREQEYQQWMASGGAQMQSGPASPPPPIDDERRARSPGLAKNFYDLPQSDFKRPYGFGGGGGGGAAPQPQPPAGSPPSGGPYPAGAPHRVRLSMAPSLRCRDASRSTRT